MEHYSQRDQRWGTKKLGTSKYTIKSHGCFITSLSMLTNKYNPDEVNELMKKNGGYANRCMVISEKASSILGLEYEGRTNIQPNHICIAETDNYKTSGVPQHFFVFAPKGIISDIDNMILDPLDNPCHWRSNKYNIVSYRLFHENKPEPVKPDLEMEQAIEWCNKTGIMTLINGNTKTDKEIAVIMKRLHDLILNK